MQQQEVKVASVFEYRSLRLLKASVATTKLVDRSCVINREYLLRRWSLT